MESDVIVFEGQKLGSGGFESLMGIRYLVFVLPEEETL